MAQQRQPGPALRADLWSGLLFAGIGALVLAVGADYPQGVPRRIGPGYVPRLLGLLMICLGGFLVVRSYWTKEPIDTTIAWRPRPSMSSTAVRARTESRPRPVL